MIYRKHSSDGKRKWMMKWLLTGKEYNFSYDYWLHKIKVNKINNGIVYLTVFSTPKDVDIGISQTKEVDIDDDGINDLKLSVVFIGSDKTTTLLIQSVNENGKIINFNPGNLNPGLIEKTSITNTASNTTGGQMNSMGVNKEKGVIDYFNSNSYWIIVVFIIINIIIIELIVITRIRR